MNKITEQTGILLNAGTNELEVLVFTLGQSVCGVNVAKVREVVRWMPPTRTPGLHPSVEGMFKLRGEVIAMVDLCRHRASKRPKAATKTAGSSSPNSTAVGRRLSSTRSNRSIA